MFVSTDVAPAVQSGPPAMVLKQERSTTMGMLFRDSTMMETVAARSAA